MKPAAPSLSFLAGGGEAGALLRRHDWAATPLGVPETWPQPLRTLVTVMLGSSQPMFVAWGPSRTLLYNNGYAPLCGAKHPWALGRPFAEVWADILDDVGPIMDRAYAGEPSHQDDLVLIMLDRRSYPEEAHFAYSYTPVRDETGGVAGVFCACSETTDKVLADRRLAFQLALGDRLRGVTDPITATMLAAEALGRQLRVARAGYGEIDEAQEIVSVARDWTDGTVASLAGEARILDAFGPAVIAELRAGRTLRVEDCLTDPRSAGAAYAASWASIGCRALIVVPLVKDGRLRAILYLHEPKPRRWTEAETALAEDVAERTWDAVERVRAEATLRASEARFRLAARAVQGIVYDLDLITGAVWRSDGLERVLGIRHEDAPATVAWWQSRVHPGDTALVAQRTRELQDAATSRLDTEYRVRHADGHWVYLHDRSFVLRDEAGRAVRLIGVSTDITARKQAEEHQRLLLLELSHRVKNTLAVVQSIAARSLSDERPLEQAREDFAKRLRALANAHSLLTASEWRAAALRAVIEGELRPYANQATLSGPDVALAPKAALTLALVVHELATNAVKHGALASATGRLEVAWEVGQSPGQPAALRLIWQEHDGPPVREPLRHGFGRTLIEQSVRHELDGAVAMEFRPDGIRCELVAPVQTVAADRSAGPGQT